MSSGCTQNGHFKGDKKSSKHLPLIVRMSPFRFPSLCLSCNVSSVVNFFDMIKIGRWVFSTTRRSPWCYTRGFRASGAQIRNQRVEYVNRSTCRWLSPILYCCPVVSLGCDRIRRLTWSITLLSLLSTLLLVCNTTSQDQRALSYIIKKGGKRWDGGYPPFRRWRSWRVGWKARKKERAVNFSQVAVMSTPA